MERRHTPGNLLKVAVKNAKPKKDTSYKLSDGGGLYLEIMQSGNKYWKYRFRAGKKDTNVTLGLDVSSGGDLDITMARKLAVEARNYRLKGGDPAKKYSKSYIPPKSTLFRTVFEHWVKLQVSNKTWNEDSKKKNVARFEEYILPEVGDTPVEILSAKEFRILLDKLVEQGKLIAAYKLYGHCKRAFANAIAEELIDSNPLQSLDGRYKEPKSTGQTRVDKSDLQEYLIKLDNDYRSNPVTILALKLVHLTFLRVGELLKARWSDIDLVRQIWEVPGVTMKNNEDFIVPLSIQAIEILRELKSLHPHSELVFPGFSKDKTKPLGSAALLKTIKRLGFDATSHGFRQIASTALNEANFKGEAVELQLDHHKEKVRLIYNRAQYLDHRADMMQWLADTYDDVRRGEATI
tara:strand:+ start:18139 stop:19359 length:1221 start_codon:yes stop_codon:yes gene_type:complete